MEALEKIPPLYLLAGVTALVVFWYVKKNGVQGATFNLASAGVGAAVDAVNGVVSGTVVGIGKTVGIPPTDPSECAKCMAAGDVWGASFACPAADFLKWVTGRNSNGGASGSW